MLEELALETRHSEILSVVSHNRSRAHIGTQSVTRVACVTVDQSIPTNVNVLVCSHGIVRGDGLEL
jgi:hypothetical protein